MPVSLGRVGIEQDPWLCRDESSRAQIKCHLPWLMACRIGRGSEAGCDPVSQGDFRDTLEEGKNNNSKLLLLQLHYYDGHREERPAFLSWVQASQVGDRATGHLGHDFLPLPLAACASAPLS